MFADMVMIFTNCFFVILFSGLTILLMIRGHSSLHVIVKVIKIVSGSFLQLLILD